jgi:uncharacterized protein
MIINSTKNTILVSSLTVADHSLTRILGLMGQKDFHNKGLIITKCNQVHTFFMSFSIDCLFLDKNQSVLVAISNLKPWRVSPKIKNAEMVVELPAGTILKSHTESGDLIIWEKRKENGHIAR